MYGNGSGSGNNMSGFGIPSLDPDACTKPILKCPCETCRAKAKEIYNDLIKKRKEAKHK